MVKYGQKVMSILNETPFLFVSRRLLFAHKIAIMSDFFIDTMYTDEISNCILLNPIKNNEKRFETDSGF